MESNKIGKRKDDRVALYCVIYDTKGRCRAEYSAGITTMKKRSIDRCLVYYINKLHTIFLNLHCINKRISSKNNLTTKGEAFYSSLEHIVLLLKQ